MLKLFYRLKRKHGAVLFFVVAVMSLLIAMATTAYYTARSSYRTVVSNYDYSQLYLSAISVSDMVMDAVTNDTSTPSANNYKDLRSAMITMAQDSAKNGSPVSPIVATSFPETLTDPNDILDYVTQNPTQDGVIDGVSVTISYIGTDKDLSTLPSGTTDVKFYYTIVTTAYYRNNTITVKDTLYNTMAVKVSNGGPTPPNPVNFSRFFTATGQQLIGGQIQKGSDRAVIINTHEISDDAYFENKYTFFSDKNASNKFVGGISSSGSIFLDKFTCAIPDPSGNDRNDWFIGEDLVIMNANANDLNLGGNNLYIKGDLYLPVDCKITAANIYVGGNIYFTGGGSSTINGNLYVGGDGTGGINYTIPDDKYSSDIQAALDSAGYNKTLNKEAGTNPVTINGDLNCNGSLDDSKGNNKLVVNGSTSSAWNPSNIDTTISVKEEQNGEFVKNLQDTNVADALKQQTSTTIYENYTSKSTALDNELSIFLPKRDESTGWQPALDPSSGYTPVYTTVTKQDGSTEQVLTGYEGPNGSEYVFDEEGNPYSKWTGTIVSDNGETANVTVDFTGNGAVSVDIPYSEDGYLLDIQGADGFSGSLDYNFHADGDDKVQQVVLKSNFTDADNNPAFSWKGSNYGNNSGSSEVTVEGGGNLAIEMGNLDKDGNYIAYDSSNATGAVVYYTAQKEAVGTPAQLEKLNGNYQGFDPNTILDSNSKPLSGYENKVMLISNKNGGTAVDGSRIDNTFFGIIYAPNGDYTNKAPNGGNTPIVGGLVAARYDAELAKFIYSEPDPDDLRLIFGSLGGDGGSTPSPGPNPTPSIEDITEGPWESEGSSYIG
ncbi:MAG: hypothetical protein ACI4KR_12090 [Ruminiclostridium sp.]